MEGYVSENESSYSVTNQKNMNQKVGIYYLKIIQIIFFLYLIALYACEDESKKPVCPPYDIVPESPYNNPVWHPLGKIIGFNRTPIKEIHYSNGFECPHQASYIYKDDSTGFWLINSDGTDQRRVLPYKLITPAWSPDGKWIAYSQGAQICIMPFDGYQFDTTAIIQLTNKGRNFYPSWSPNGDKIAFYESVCDGENICGIWICDVISKQLQNIAKYGMYPGWQPSSVTLIFFTNAINNVGDDIGDSIWSYNYSIHNKTLLRYLSVPNYDNRDISYSPNGNTIAFTSASSTGGGFQLYTINSDGSNLRKLTNEGCLSYSWSPEGKIVYLNFDYSRIDAAKGTLWIMDSDGNNKRQLTYNSFKLIQ